MHDALRRSLDHARDQPQNDAPMITTVIFDMDGLLIDSEPLWREAEIAAFARVGLPLTEEMCRQTMGLRSDEVVQYWFDRHPWSGATLKQVEAEVLGHLSELIRSDAAPMAGAIELMRRLESAGLEMAIASSSPLSIIEAVADAFGFKRYVRKLRSAETQPYGKPHPGVFIDTAKDFGRAPASCLVFEDSINGVIAGKAARMVTVAVPEPLMLDRPEFTIADLTIPSLSDFDDRCFERFLAR
jgi:mannitol-1-/sugar-/sorbitol-6-/2-deoxyglucose-6-phosphatase